MRMFKFRSLDNIEFTLDIILNERLFCADFSTLNDPFEGMYLTKSTIRTKFFPSAREYIRREDVRSLYEGAEFSRVCSLSEEFQDVRMWSYYSNSHRGVAIEIDFENCENDLHKVEYVDELKSYGNTVLTSPFADEVMRHKTFHWKHEKEWRVITNLEYYEIPGRVKAIYLGSRVSKLHSNLLEKITPSHIEVKNTKINDKTLRVELV